jgi:hypothetical protein
MNEWTPWRWHSGHKKQRATWKPHYHNSPSWVFLKVNDNPSIYLFENQTIHWIIYHIGMAPLEVFAMWIRCKKGLIAYHKSNRIRTMEKHVESNHVHLLKIFLKYVAFKVPKSPFHHELSKQGLMFFLIIFLVFFCSSSKFNKDDLTQLGFVEDFMLFVKGLFMRTTKSIWL